MSNQEHVWRLGEEEDNIPERRHFNTSPSQVRYYHTYNQAQRTMVGTNVEIETTALIQTMDDIMSLVTEHYTAYNERIGRRPSYLSLNRDAYQSLHVVLAQQGWRAGTGLAEEFMGMEIVYNPFQGRPVIVLGTPMQELMDGGMYR